MCFEGVSFMSTMSTRRWEELNVFERSTCSCSCPQELASCAMATEVSWIASWVHVCSSSWAQHKRWIPIGSMGCVHPHWRILATKRWGNPSRIWNTVEKTKEVGQKLRKISQIVSQTPTLALEHDKIWARWALNIMSKNMLGKVWRCKCFEMESWSQTICCPMNCSNKRKHVRTRGGRRSHGILRCC
jgi:hypothetical protein